MVVGEGDGILHASTAIGKRMLVYRSIIVAISVGAVESRYQLRFQSSSISTYKVRISSSNSANPEARTGSSMCFHALDVIEVGLVDSVISDPVVRMLFDLVCSES